jgi:hypothetical protein
MCQSVQTRGSSTPPQYDEPYGVSLVLKWNVMA